MWRRNEDDCRDYEESGDHEDFRSFKFELEAAYRVTSSHAAAKFFILISCILHSPLRAAAQSN